MFIPTSVSITEIYLKKYVIRFDGTSELTNQNFNKKNYGMLLFIINIWLQKVYKGRLNILQDPERVATEGVPFFFIFPQEFTL